MQRATSAASSDNLGRVLRSATRRWPGRLTRAVTWQAAPALVRAGILYLLQIACALSTPVVINGLLLWVNKTDTTSVREGALWVLALAAASVTGFVATDQFDRISKRAGIRARAAVCGLLYTKALNTRLVDAQQDCSRDANNSGGGDSSGSAGAHNLFSVDALSLEHFFDGLLRLVLQPLEIAGIIALLAIYVEWAALGGLAAIFVIAVILQLATARMQPLMAGKAARADDRSRDLQELLLGSKAIKLRAWEGRFQARILAHRAAEGDLTKRIGRLLAVINVLSSNGIDVISASVVAVYAFAMGRELTPAVVFTYWVLLSLLHGRIFTFPIAIKHVKESLGALRRLEAFLLPAGGAEVLAHSGSAPATTDPSCLLPAGSAGPAVSVAGASFSWERTAEANSGVTSTSETASTNLSRGVLVDVNFHARHGSLVAIVGAVGTGKSSLLLSLLGETRIESGKPAVISDSHDLPSGSPAWPPEQVAYVPQTAWIVRGSSIRDNIILARPWDASRYAEVLRVTALGTDLARLPRGDLTVVSACTLSGGQRQRISIARAAYGHAPLVLLDDCLSALDGRIGAHVFEECISRWMAGRTRILATTSALVLQRCDAAGVMLPQDQHLLALAAASSCATMPAALDARGATEDKRSDGDQDVPANGVSSSSGGPFSIMCGTVEELSQQAIAAQVLSSLLAAPPPVDDITSSTPSASSQADATPLASLPVPETSLSDAAALPPHESLGGSGVIELSAVSVGACKTSSAEAGHYITMQAAAEGAFSLPFFRSLVLGVYGPHCAAAIVGFLLLESAAIFVGFYWLSLWSDDAGSKNASQETYMGIVALCVALELMFDYLRQRVFAYATRRSADALHDALLFRVVHAPQQFFDSGVGGVPAIMSWLTRDLDVLERNTWYDSEYCLLGGCFLASVMAWDAALVPYTLIPAAIVAAPLVFILLDLGKPEASGSDGASRDANSRLRGYLSCPGWLRGGPSVSSLLAAADAAKVPLLEHFGATLEGLESLRAYAAGPRFAAAYHELMDSHSAAWLRCVDVQASRALFANLLGAVYYIGSVAALVPLHVYGHVTAASIGMVIVNACFASYLTATLLEHKGNLEALAGVRGALVARICAIPQEASIADCVEDAVQSQAIARAYLPAFRAAAKKAGEADELLSSVVVPANATAVKRVSAEWPSAGHVVVRDLQLRYSSTGPLVLRGIDIEVRPGTRVSVVGRTGAGKSSLLISLLRLVEPCGGSVTIDGIDVASLPLRLLRRRVCVISQDPLFFTDTLRRNLDPFGDYPDADLLRVLEQVGLLRVARAMSTRQLRSGAGASTPAKLAGGLSPLASDGKPLDALVAERGSNLSAGQQQLLAIARALLCSPRLLLLDEAYAAVDADTEAELHALVSRTFAGCAVLQVAHRLHTVVDSDEVVVMADGRVAERGPPHDLLQRPDSAFRAMVDAVPEPQRGRLYKTAAESLASKHASSSRAFGC